MDCREATVWFTSSVDVNAFHVSAGRVHQIGSGTLAIISVSATKQEVEALLDSGFWTEQENPILFFVEAGEVKVPLTKRMEVFVEAQEKGHKVTVALADYWVAIEAAIPVSEFNLFIDVLSCNATVLFRPPPAPPEHHQSVRSPLSALLAPVPGLPVLSSPKEHGAAAGGVRVVGGGVAKIIGNLGIISAAALRRGGDALKKGDPCAPEDAIVVPQPVCAAVSGAKKVTGKAAHVTGAVVGAVLNVAMAAGRGVGRAIAPSPKPGAQPGAVHQVGRALVDSVGVVAIAFTGATAAVKGEACAQAHGVVAHRCGEQAGDVAVDAAAAGFNCFEVYQNCGLFNPVRLANKCALHAAKHCGKEVVKGMAPPDPSCPPPAHPLAHQDRASASPPAATPPSLRPAQSAPLRHAPPSGSSAPANLMAASADWRVGAAPGAANGGPQDGGRPASFRMSPPPTSSAAVPASYNAQGTYGSMVGRAPMDSSRSMSSPYAQPQVMTGRM